jgi:hypothetical protein
MARILIREVQRSRDDETVGFNSSLLCCTYLTLLHALQGRISPCLILANKTDLANFEVTPQHVDSLREELKVREQFPA